MTSGKNATRHGHVLYAASGAIYERVVTVDGSLDFVEVTRHQTKRDRKPDGTWAFYARHTLTCRSTDSVHDWCEPLTPMKTDADHKFNRSDYLRVLPPTDSDYSRVYGMRADTESLNAQFERASTTGASPRGIAQPDGCRADG